jgi:acetylcholinesterase
MLPQGFKKDKTLLSQYENDFVRLVPLDLNITGGRYSTEADLVSDRVRDFYLGGRSISINTVEEMILLLTDIMFVRGMTNAAKIHAKYSGDNIYFYRFAYDGALGLYKRLLNVNRPGICHGDELGYLFYFGFFNVKIDASSSEFAVKQRLLRLWTNFVKSG